MRRSLSFLRPTSRSISGIVPRVSILGILTLGVVMPACSALRPQADPSRFYVLTPMPTTSQPAFPSLASLTIGVGPIVLPSYLQRPQIVSRVDENRLAISEVDRWADDLEDSFTRVLAEDLSVLTGSVRVPTFPWLAALEPDYQIVVGVLAFEKERQQANLRARWMIRTWKQKEILLVRDSTILEPTPSRGTAGGVAALSAAVTTLAREIAAALDTVHRKAAASNAH